MPRSVELHLPTKVKDSIVAKLISHEHVHRVRSVLCADARECTVTFICGDKHLSQILKQVESTGLGTKFGSVDIYRLESTIPSLNKVDSASKTRKYNLTERRTIREMEDTVHGGLHFTTDFVLMIIIASIIAGVGLLTDSAVLVVASMLVSPMMGPIIGTSFGLAVRDWRLVKLAFLNEMRGVLLCSLVGGMTGSLAILFYEPLGIPELIQASTGGPHTSTEMISRGTPINLVASFFVAAPSGVGAALAVTNAGISGAIIGIAISTSLLPPLINSSIYLTMGAIYSARGSASGDFVTLGVFSFLLYLLNLTTITLFCLVTFKVKGVNRAAIEFKDHDDPTALAFPDAPISVVQPYVFDKSDLDIL